MTAPHGSTEERRDELIVSIPQSLAGARVDRAVAMVSGLPRSQVDELVAAGHVQLDGTPVGSRRDLVRAGQLLRVALPAPRPSGPVADPTVAFSVVYEDPHLVVVDKPAGLVVHHGAGHRSGTLVDGLLARYPELGRPGVGPDPWRPGIVHRLDKGTSGLLVVARTPEAFTSLSAQLQAHEAGRDYVALVGGRVASDKGVIDAPIGRSSRVPTRMALTRGGRPARTSYRVLARYAAPEPTSLLELQLETGRTHQVRVHLAAIGHPVLGDERYGTGRVRPVAAMLPPGRVFLHAARLSFEHPDGRRMTWESPLPADLVAVVDHVAAEVLFDR
ncbi:MAG TPA: RluA family pseudouridine synthase [Acidimicrobiales bacterium]|nr:RluA family pseudouridine synthase [Acidimicrobiales bacterium]